MPKLNYLNICNNLIEKISNIIVPNLTQLSLSYNKISDICRLNSLTNVKDVYLDNNQIKKIPDLSGTINLTELYLQCNLINNISNLNSHNLTIVNLSFNRIEEVHGLNNLTNVKK